MNTNKPALNSTLDRQYEWPDENSPATRLSRFLLIGSAKKPKRKDRFIYGDMDGGTVCKNVALFLAAVDRAGIGEQLSKVIDELQ